MTDISKCPSCGSLDVVSSKCTSCGYDNSMLLQHQYTLTITSTAAANGTITGATTADKFPYMTEVVLTFNANAAGNKQFISWKVDEVGAAQATITTNPIKILMTKSKTVTVVAATKKSVVIGAATNCTVKVNGTAANPAGETKYFELGTVLSIECIPEEKEEDWRYVFTKWTGSGGDNSTDNPIEVTLDVANDALTFTPNVDKEYSDYDVVFYGSDSGTRLTASEANACPLENIEVDDENAAMLITVDDS